MKRSLLLILLLSLASVIAFAVCYRLATRPLRAIPGDLPTELAWLRTEFQFDDAAFAKVRALHAAYEPRCMEYCEQITRVNARLHALATSATTTPEEMEAALREAADLQRECRSGMWRHIEAIACTLPPREAQRYREMMAHTLVQRGQPYPPTH